MFDDDEFMAELMHAPAVLPSPSMVAVEEAPKSLTPALRALNERLVRRVMARLAVCNGGGGKDGGGGGERGGATVVGTAMRAWRSGRRSRSDAAACQAAACELAAASAVCGGGRRRLLELHGSTRWSATQGTGYAGLQRLQSAANSYRKWCWW